MQGRGMLYTTYISNLKHCPTSGAKVLIITRQLKDELKKSLKEEYGAVHVPDLSPTSTLLWDYKEGRITWPEYTIELIRQLSTNQMSVKCLNRIFELLEDGTDVWLVCYENLNKGLPCHRTIVANIIQSAGYDCEEYFM